MIIPLEKALTIVEKAEGNVPPEALNYFSEGVASRMSREGFTENTKGTLEQWATNGLIKLYYFSEVRMRSATDLVIQHNLSKQRYISAPNATIIGFAEELGMNIVTFEECFKAVSYRAEAQL